MKLYRYVTCKDCLTGKAKTRKIREVYPENKTGEPCHKCGSENTDIKKMCYLKGGVSTGQTNLNRAKEELGAAIKNKAEGKSHLNRAKKLTLKAACSRHEARSATKAPRTVTQYTSCRKHIIEYFGGSTLLEAIDKEQLDRYVAELAKKYKPRSIIQYIKVLRTIGRDCSLDAPRFADAIRRVETPKPKDTFYWLTPAAYKRIFAVANSHHRLAMTIAIETGYRYSDVVDLQWSHIRLADREISKVIIKTGLPLTIPISDTLFKVLKDEHAKRNICDYVCKPQGKPFEGYSENTDFRFSETALKAGIALPVGQAFHVLRHTFATWHYKKYRDIYMLSRLMGHSSIEQTKKYAHVDVEDMKEAMGVKVA